MHFYKILPTSLCLISSLSYALDIYSQDASVIDNQSTVSNVTYIEAEPQGVNTTDTMQGPALDGNQHSYEMMQNGSSINGNAIKEYMISAEKGVDATLLEALNLALTDLSAQDLQVTDLRTATSCLKEAEFFEGKLRLVFDRNLLETYLNEQGTAIWEGLSNPIMVWLVNYSENDSHIITDNNQDALASALYQSAQDANMRIMFPLMDLDDIQAVNTSTILSHNDKAIANATVRYGSDYIIVGALSLNTDNTGILKWNLLDKSGNILNSSEIQGDIHEIANLAISDAVKVLSKKQEMASDATSESTAQNTTTDSQDTESEVKVLPADLNKDTLGAGTGFVRVKISGTQSLNDLKTINEKLIIFGYDGNTRISSIKEDGIVIEINTQSDASILDGTMRHSGEFTRVGPWCYEYMHSTGKLQGFTNKMGVAKNTAPVAVAPAHNGENLNIPVIKEI